MKRCDLDTSEIARFQAWLIDTENKDDPPLTTLEPFFEYLAKVSCIIRDPYSKGTGASTEELFMAGQLFRIGCVRMGFLEERPTRRLVDALVLGEVPSPPLVYQILTYILRIEKHECGINLMLMMPLFALMETKWYPLHPNRSSTLTSVIQSFALSSDRYARKSIMLYDPLDLLRKLQLIISTTAKDERYVGKKYLEYALDSVRYVASIYLAVVIKKICSDQKMKSQADKMLGSMLLFHQTVVSTHISQHRTRR